MTTPPGPPQIVCLLTSEVPPGRKGDCTDPKLPYLAFFDDAERRTRAGERQTYCRTCELWQWRLCDRARAAQGVPDDKR